jgi:DNA-binding HxlR family transcriptional regulator
VKEGVIGFSAEHCSVKRALDIVGEKWTFLVLRDAFYGARRFEQFHERVGCARNILSDRLTTLVGHEVLERVPYREPGQRERHEYRLTEKGRDLLTALIALMHWGDRWEAGESGPAVKVLHRACGHPVEVVLRCSHDLEPLSVADTVPRAGPGARQVTATR